MGRSSVRAGPVAIALALLALGPACTIIVDPSSGLGPEIPVPIPLTCTPPVGPTAHVLASVRIERSTANLADRYQEFLEKIVLGLAGAGVVVTRAVLIRADERPVPTELIGAWGCHLDDPARLTPSAAIRWYAEWEAPSEGAIGCAVDPLLRAGQEVANLVTSFPDGFGGTSGIRVFGEAPDAVLVVHLDALERRAGLEDPACSGARRLAERDGEGRAAWIDYAGPNPPLDRVFHWFVATDEGIAREAFVAACKRFEGFPAEALDALDPSANALYGPLGLAVEAGGGSAASLPMCEMLSQPTKWLVDRIVGLGGALGLGVDRARVARVIAEGVPEAEGDPSRLGGSIGVEGLGR